MSDPRLSYYHLRYHLWVGVYRDSSGSSSTAIEQKAHKRDQTGPDGTLLKHGMPRYESEGRRFESCRARYKIPANAAFLPLSIVPKVGLYRPFDHLSFSETLSQVAIRNDPSPRIQTFGASFG